MVSICGGESQQRAIRSSSRSAAAVAASSRRRSRRRQQRSRATAATTVAGFAEMPLCYRAELLSGVHATPRSGAVCCCRCLLESVAEQQQLRPRSAASSGLERQRAAQSTTR